MKYKLVTTDCNIQMGSTYYEPDCYDETPCPSLHGVGGVCYSSTLLSRKWAMYYELETADLKEPVHVAHIVV